MNMLKRNDDDDDDDNNKYPIFIITIIISPLFHEVERYYNSTDLVKFFLSLTITDITWNEAS
jgi:hypothetical protein